MKKTIIFLLINYFFIVWAMAQIKTVNYIIPKTKITLQEGIYMNIDEFLNNAPSIKSKFEISNKNPDYILIPGEIDKYFITYYDGLNRKYELLPSQIWGYFNGFGIFVIINNKPYELRSLNTISLVTYEKNYDRNDAIDLLSGFSRGYYSDGLYRKIKSYFLDLRNNTIFLYTKESVEQIISKDYELYNEFINDKSIKRKYKHGTYLNKFNSKYPITIDENGIRLNPLSLVIDSISVDYESNNDLENFNQEKEDQIELMEKYYNFYCDCINNINPESLNLNNDFLKCQSLQKPEINNENLSEFSAGLSRYVHYNCPKYYLIQNHILNKRYDDIISELKQEQNAVANCNLKNLKFVDLTNKKTKSYFEICDSIKYEYKNDTIEQVSKITWISNIEYKEEIIKDLSPNLPPHNGDVMYCTFVGFKNEYFLVHQKFNGIITEILFSKYK